MTSNRLSRTRLSVIALTRFGAGLVIVLALLLVPAGTWAYREAWAWTAILFGPMAGVFVWLLRSDPALLERRLMMKEKEKDQSLLLKLGSLCYLLAFVVPGLDHRFGWSAVPLAVEVAAGVVMLAGYGFFILVLRENSYASRVIEVTDEQRVVTTGPYALVRHPMYLAILLMFLATPVVLGSWWGVPPMLVQVGVILIRIRGEERVLSAGLPGYAEYVRVTRWRLVPGLW